MIAVSFVCAVEGAGGPAREPARKGDPKAVLYGGSVLCPNHGVECSSVVAGVKEGKQ